MITDIQSNEQLSQILEREDRLTVITIYNHYSNSDIQAYKQIGGEMLNVDFLFINLQTVELNDQFKTLLTNGSLPCTTFQLNGQITRMENNLHPDNFRNITSSFLNNQNPQS